MSEKYTLPESYSWPIRVVTDYDDDRVTISEGTMQHIAMYHADDVSSLTVDRITEVCVSPAGGVYRNHSTHSHPNRLNYYSSPVDTEYGIEYVQVVIDKTIDPAKVITAYSTDRIGAHGECILEASAEAQDDSLQG